MKKIALVAALPFALTITACGEQAAEEPVEETTMEEPMVEEAPAMDPMATETPATDPMMDETTTTDDTMTAETPETMETPAE